MIQTSYNQTKNIALQLSQFNDHNYETDIFKHLISFISMLVEMNTDRNTLVSKYWCTKEEEEQYGKEDTFFHEKERAKAIGGVD